MAIDITPDPTGKTEVSIGDEVEISWTQDARLLQDQDLSLKIPDDDVDVDASQMTETDNGDGTYTYTYSHVLTQMVTRGRFVLDGSQGKAADRFTISAQL